MQTSCFPPRVGCLDREWQQLLKDSSLIGAPLPSYQSCCRAIDGHGYDERAGLRRGSLAARNIPAFHVDESP